MHRGHALRPAAWIVGFLAIVASAASATALVIDDFGTPPVAVPVTGFRVDELPGAFDRTISVEASGGLVEVGGGSLHVGGDLCCLNASAQLAVVISYSAPTPVDLKINGAAAFALTLGIDDPQTHVQSLELILFSGESSVIASLPGIVGPLPPTSFAVNFSSFMALQLAPGLAPLDLFTNVTQINLVAVVHAGGQSLDITRFETIVPEPGTAVLIGVALGIAALAAPRRSRR